MVTDMGKLHKRKNIIKPIIWRHFEGIHDRFLKDPEFRDLNSNMIELKKSVCRWTGSRRKISPII